MNEKLCKETVVFAGIGKDAKIKCYLSQVFDFSTGQMTFTATIGVFKVEGRSDWRTVGSDLSKHTQKDFATFEEAASWLNERCEEFSIVEFRQAPKEKSLCH